MTASARLLLIGDVHAEDAHLARALDCGAAMGVDQVLCVGDIVDGPGDVARCARLLQDAGALVVRGNHDRWAADGRGLAPPYPPEVVAWLAGLPATRVVDTTAGSLLLCHGVGDNDMIRISPDDVGYALEFHLELTALVGAGVHRLMVGGHTHRVMVHRFGGLTVVNPGTLRRGDDPGFLILDVARGVVERFAVSETAVTPRDPIALS